MKRSHVSRLNDILENIDIVGEMVAGVDFADYGSQTQLRKAVERCFEIISEASRFIPLEAKARHPNIPWPEIAAIGNLLRHEYQRVDDFVIWSAAMQSLPVLRVAILDLLRA